MIQYHCYENLANAIVADAAHEYCRALRRWRAHPNDTNARSALQEKEGFFYSRYFEILTDLNPETLVERLRKEVKE